MIVLLCLASLLALCACGSGNTLWNEASPATSVLNLYYFDGESGWCGFISDQRAEKNILSDLGKVSAKAAPDWTPEQLMFPIYGVEIGTKDGMGVLAAWSNGYLILRDGRAYQFDCDFAALSDAYSWSGGRRSISSVAEMPCGRYLTQNGARWMQEYLSAAAPLTPPEGITMELNEQTAETLAVTLFSDADEEWCYGEYFSLQVLLDGTWYTVPTTPEENWAFTDIGYILSPGKTAQETYHLRMYGDLPEGDYRLVVEGLTAEFSVD